MSSHRHSHRPAPPPDEPAPLLDNDDDADALPLHEYLVPGARQEPLAEELGESFVVTATSGQDSFEDLRDQEFPEEVGGPFVESPASREFDYEPDASNPPDADREPLPLTASEGA